jgi:TolA protein
LRIALVLSLALFPLLLIIDKAHAAEGLTAQVYNVLGQNNAPYIPQGASPVITTNVPNIDFQWGSGSVLGGPSEDVIVRFTGSIRSDSTQNISFLATADDGTRLYIGGVLVADDWFDKGGGGTTTDPISFTAGVPKTIELMYYENGGGANVFLRWDQSGSMGIIPASAFTSQAAPVVKTIGPPRNLTISSNETSTVLSWQAPDTGNTQPERYAISFNCSGCNGWGIATGNVGGPNSLNTTITIDHSLLNGLMPAGTVWSFHIRSDNDTFALYSANSNVVTGSTYVAPAPQPSPTPTPSPSETTTVTTPTPETITVTTPIPETTTVITPTPSQTETVTITTPETITVTTPTPSETATVTTPTGPTEAEIAAQVAAQAAAQQAEAARIQAETAALIAQQAAAAQAEAERIAALQAAQEAERIRAEAKAKAESDRIEAEIEAARIQAEIEAQEEADRIAEEVKAAEEKAEAEAKAEADRIEAERIAEEERAIAEAEAEAERIAAEEEAIAEALRQAEEDAKAEADAIEAEEKAKELEEEKAAEEEAIAEEEELKEILEDAKDGKELTEEQKETVVAALIEDLKPGESISAAQVQASGVSYADLPPETPIEVRTDESGNALIITAEVAANIELVQDPGALLEAAFTDPGAALAALGSIGADMTEAEREEATDMVVATVVATGAAINAAAVATSGAAGGSGGGGGSSGGSSGSNSPGSRGGRKW